LDKMIKRVPEKIEIDIKETKKSTSVKVRFSKLYNRWHTYKIRAYEEHGEQIKLELKRC